MNSKHKLKDLRSDFLSGAKAGFLSGILVAPWEYLKVSVQANSKQRALYTLLNRGMPKKLIKVVPPFSLNFGAVCALEFSVNDYIKNQLGLVPGLVSSALTGALFLTAADHLMFRQDKNHSVSNALKELAGKKLFTGLTPMIARESMFILSVLYIGPYIGSLLNNSDSEEKAYWQDFAGRLTSGVVTTLLSQPFDSLARELQKLELEKKPTKILDCLKNLQAQHTKENKSFYQHALLRGAIPRMVLASFGGALAGGFFDYFKTRAN